MVGWLVVGASIALGWVVLGWLVFKVANQVVAQNPLW